MREDKYKVDVLPAAYNKLNAHTHFIAQVSVGAAEKFYDDFNKSIESLKANPGMYPVYNLKKPIEGVRFHCKLFHKERYRIVFRIIDNSVFIYDIQDCRQDIGRYLV